MKTLLVNVCIQSLHRLIDWLNIRFRNALFFGFRQRTVFVWLIDWLIDLIEMSDVSLFDWLIDWSTYWTLTKCIFLWFSATYCSIDWLINREERRMNNNWLINWLMDWSSDWLINWILRTLNAEIHFSCFRATYLQHTHTPSKIGI